MSVLSRFKFFLWYFSRFKIPMIGYLKPKLLVLDEQQVVVKLPLKRRSKNHLNSMYFGALSVGADLAGGLHGFYYATKNQVNVSLAFKSFQAQFLRRPEHDVYFVCEKGDEINAMIKQSQASGERVNKIIPVRALVHYPQHPEEIASFNLELSLKVIN